MAAPESHEYTKLRGYRPLKDADCKFLCFSHDGEHYIKVAFGFMNEEGEFKNGYWDAKVIECPFCDYRCDALREGSRITTVYNNPNQFPAAKFDKDLLSKKS